MNSLIKLLVSLLVCSITSSSYAAFMQTPPTPIPPDRKVVDRGPEGSVVTVVWTDKDGNVIMKLDPDGKRVPSDAREDTIGPSGQVEFPAKDVLPNIDVPGGALFVNDFIQSISTPNPGTSVLHVRAFEPVGSDFFVTPYWLFSFTVPDMFGDTNGDGRLDASDTLYSAVNLLEFLDSPPDFNIGDVFQITNGVSAFLPGMLFGTQEIVADASSPNGWRNPAPFSGVGIAGAAHSVPEPNMYILITMGFLAIGLTRCRVSRYL